jgi:hypothetical protein
VAFENALNGIVMCTVYQLVSDLQNQVTCDGKVSSMHVRLYKCIKVLRSIKLNVGDLLGRFYVEWIFLTCGMDQLQCWWAQKETSGSLKSGTFFDSLSSCWLCKRGCAVCWVT